MSAEPIMEPVGEVTSTNHETNTGPKLRTYAAAGVPVYVLINRETKTAHCHTTPVLPGDDPTKAYYDTESKVDLGEPLPPPGPVSHPGHGTLPGHLRPRPRRDSAVLARLRLPEGDRVIERTRPPQGQPLLVDPEFAMPEHTSRGPSLVT
ncbi:Uma2 family endonuclease [Streptomyces sp. NPDC005492]|uniref:Uma2 family endonuclease n=1 Tax=Streptomyces sp. NPDC005492 TaxID=3156883 RepID=UPI0033ACEFA5